MPYALRRVDDLVVYDTRPTLAALLASGEPVDHLAAALHETVVEVTRELVAEARRRTGVDEVGLSGGVLQNRRLAVGLLGGLTADGLTVHLNEQVPCNDGGISYGQVAVAAATLSDVPSYLPTTA
ncbi:MAG TPA: hypothetical protein PKB06_07295 [Actinotalea sp.]|nr:hypothetical protein [Actinotalea sp.]